MSHGSTRRFITLSVITIVLSFVVHAAVRAGQTELVKGLLLVLGPVAVLWDGERRSSRTRNELAGPVNDAAAKAQAAATVTVESFKAMQAELKAIKTSLNGEFDQRIVRTVNEVIDGRLPALADLVAERLTRPDPMKVRT